MHAKGLSVVWIVSSTIFFEWTDIARSQEQSILVNRDQLVGGALVRATAEEIDDRSPLLKVRFVVQEVLGGSDCDVGERFEVDVSRDGQSLLGLAVFRPQIEVCQTVAWLVYRREDRKLTRRYDIKLGLDYCPKAWGHLMAVRETDQDPRTLSAVALCKTIREVAQVDSSQRWDRLETICKHDEPLIAGWAMSVLASVDKHAAQPFFQRLVTGEKLPEKNIEMLKDLLERLADE